MKKSKGARPTKDRFTNSVENYKKATLVANDLSISVTTVSVLLKEYEIPTPSGFYGDGKHSTSVSEETWRFRRQIIEDGIIAGKTIFEIAELSKISSHTLRNTITKYKIVTPKGFRNRNLPVGRKPGFKQPPEIIEAMRARMLGEGNHFFGKKHSDETRSKMSTNHCDFTGENNPLVKAIARDPTIREKMSIQKTIAWANKSPEQMKKFAEKLSSRESRGLNPGNTGGNGRNHKRGEHTSFKSDTFNYRSSWELYFAEMLDNNKYVVKYTYEGIAIPYYDEKTEITRHFRPDFRVYFASGEKSLIEIKPAGLVPHQLSKLKAQYFWANENIYHYELLTKVELYDSHFVDTMFRNMNRGIYTSKSVIRFGLA